MNSEPRNDNSISSDKLDSVIAKLKLIIFKSHHEKKSEEDLNPAKEKLLRSYGYSSEVMRHILRMV